MKPKSDGRIPMFIESERGDDKVGTAPSGALITDDAAIKAGVVFTPGVPPGKIQEAVEGQLRDDKWVVIEKGDGKTELLTKNDLPKPEEIREDIVPEEKSGKEAAGPGNPKAPEKPIEDDWRAVFSAVPVKPKPEPKPEPKPDPKSEEAAKSAVKPACTAVPKKEKEIWKNKFENIKSATATHKGKGG